MRVAFVDVLDLRPISMVLASKVATANYDVSMKYSAIFPALRLA